ncbi:MAG: hypothetical protein Q7J58_01675 [Hydrogenophaga sp.]|uniref:hypothetical protein n=1 Tax=Hydrogenophaga sp. TaxID=1904254 RepID=UPI002727138E|nr:hypothetical protein [Hydrogenophaga sp.]MDO9568079.1 hypothetical protein [Hydrogenophaga sp.]MDP3374366.1 hypothetical protein [Hydrogenophaga sp.]
MNYQLSEDEHRSMELLRDQLNLISGLLAMAKTDAELSGITSTSLFAFLDERCGDLNRVLKAVSERYSLQFELERDRGTLEYVDWLFALRIARGDILQTPNGAEHRITERLTKAAQIDSDMKRVLDEWLGTLGQLAVQKAQTVADKPLSTKHPVQRRKRNPSVARA